MEWRSSEDMKQTLCICLLFSILFITLETVIKYYLLKVTFLRKQFSTVFSSLSLSEADRVHTSIPCQRNWSFFVLEKFFLWFHHDLPYLLLAVVGLVFWFFCLLLFIVWNLLLLNFPQFLFPCLIPVLLLFCCYASCCLEFLAVAFLAYFCLTATCDLLEVSYCLTFSCSCSWVVFFSILWFAVKSPTVHLLWSVASINHSLLPSFQNFQSLDQNWVNFEGFCVVYHAWGWSEHEERSASVFWSYLFSSKYFLK